jgi:hypothetical protein
MSARVGTAAGSTQYVLDVNLCAAAGVWGLLPGVPQDDNNWSAGDVSADGAVLYLATSDGGLSIVDSRCNSSGGSVVIANRKVSGPIEEEGLHGVHRQLRRNEHPKTKEGC